MCILETDFLPLLSSLFRRAGMPRYFIVADFVVIFLTVLLLQRNNDHLSSFVIPSSEGWIIL